MLEAMQILLEKV